MGFRAGDHPRSKPMWETRCSKCGDMARVPFDPKTSRQPVLCQNCRLIYT